MTSTINQTSVAPINPTDAWIDPTIAIVPAAEAEAFRAAVSRVLALHDEQSAIDARLTVAEEEARARTGGISTPEVDAEQANFEAAVDDLTDAQEAMLAAPPETLAGLRIMLDTLIKTGWAEGQALDLAHALLASPALASVSI